MDQAHRSRTSDSCILTDHTVCRKSAQKPADELYEAFKLAHPDVGPGTVVDSSSAPVHRTLSDPGVMSDPPLEHRYHRLFSYHWRFTPSILDSSSFAFSSLMNQHSGYYTPTASAMSIPCHNQAGDLHTPNMGFELGTPLSMPTSEGQILSTATAVDMHAFNSQLMASSHYSEPHLFAPQQSYAPSSFLHQESGYEALEAANDEIPVSLQPGTFDATMAAPPKPSSDKSASTASRSL